MSTAKFDAVLDIGDRSIPIAIRRFARARTYRLRYDSRSEILRLSMPQNASVRRAVEWAKQQQEWVFDQLAATPEKVAITPGSAVLLEGKLICVDWSAQHPRAPQLDDDVLRVGGPSETLSSRIIRWMRARALQILTAETCDMADGAGLRVARISVGDPRSRWGSCSGKGEIRYSWRLIMAPPMVRRAIVAHEVAHLAHMDHSPQFHAAHTDIFGEDPGPARDWLRVHGADLQRFGA